MKRSKHTLSHYRLVTGNMGELLPIQCVPVLPGDTMQGHNNVLIRMSPLNTPVMHPVNVRVHTFFCPNRILMPEWEDFITGGNDGQGEGAEIPQVLHSGEKKSLASYLGVNPPSGFPFINGLPIKAANRIFNEYYRDQDLVPEKDEDLQGLSRIAWEKDYFSSARPWSQRGPQVTLPVDVEAPVKSRAPQGQAFNIVNANTDVTSLLDTAAVGSSLSKPADTAALPEANSLFADMAGLFSVNDFRAAFSLQRYQEARARYGARFTEYLRYLGITPSDARLQRPEFISGGTTRLNFSEVLQTAPTDASGGPEEATGIGDMFGHGIAGAKTGRWRRFFEEHGYLITFLSVRPKAVYINGIPREFLKTTKEDFFQKELANLGQQEIWQSELFGQDTNGLDTFGFQDRYHEYRSHPSQIQGDFVDVLNAWHLGRDLQSDVTLNQAFVECNPDRRIFQDTGNNDTMWIMANNHLVARRMVPKRAVPRIL